MQVRRRQVRRRPPRRVVRILIRARTARLPHPRLHPERPHAMAPRVRRLRRRMGNGHALKGLPRTESQDGEIGVRPTGPGVRRPEIASEDRETLTAGPVVKDSTTGKVRRQDSIRAAGRR